MAQWCSNYFLLWHQKYNCNVIFSFLSQNGLEEAKTMLEQADRARKMAEQELSDTNEALADLTMQNQVTQLGNAFRPCTEGIRGHIHQR